MEQVSEFEAICHWISVQLQECEHALQLGDAESLRYIDEKLSGIDSRIDCLSDSSRKYVFDCGLPVAVETLRGHFSRSKGDLDNAIVFYTEALSFLDESRLQEIDKKKRASGLYTYRGLCGIDSNEKSVLEQSLSDFEEAIKLRKSQTDQGNLWGQSAAWINRGDILRKLDGVENLREAILSYQQGERCLVGFDLAQNASFRTRAALTWIKRGECAAYLERKYGESVAEPFSFYEQGTEILRKGVESGCEESRRVLAGALLNKARDRMSLENPDYGAVRYDLEEAASLKNESRLSGLDAVRLDLQIKVFFCQSLVRENYKKNCDQITDLVEESLRNLDRELPESKLFPPDIDSAAGELFSCGAETYLRFMPRFLSEYILEFLDPDGGAEALEYSTSCHRAAVQILWKALADLKAQTFPPVGSSEFNERLELESSWEDCRNRLAELRSQKFKKI